jgi:hypothetical protein
VSGPGLIVYKSSPNQAPGRALWEPFANQEYVVFIDESFFKFFDFRFPDGNFVHGAMGLPASQYDRFRNVIAPAVAEYKTAYEKERGQEPEELKSADLYKVKFGVRRRLVLKLNAALASCGGFVAGFYTGNKGYVLENIREELITKEGVTSVPKDHSQLFDAAVEKLNSDASSGPGMSHLIAELMFLPVMSMAFFLSALNAHFRVVYDPRQIDEDLAVKNSVEGVVTAVTNAEKVGTKSKLLGFDFSRRSQDELGLQIADIVAGEVRRFFRFNPDLLTSCSDLNLITFDHREGEETLLEQVDGRWFKKGRRVRIPHSTLKRALTPNENCALPYLRKLFAAGLVTCITDYGTERDVALFEGYFLDLCD